MQTEEYNVLLQRLDIVEKELEQTKGEIKALSERTTETEKSQLVITTKLDNLISSVTEIKTTLKAIESKPSQWWDKLIGGIIGALAGGVVAMILK